MSSGRGAALGGLATVLGLGVLAVFGFGLGLVAGGLWQAPGLVMQHLLGGTQEVVWSGEPTPSAGPAGASAPGPTAAAEPARPGAPAAPGAEAAPPVSAQPPARGFAIQVGAFRERVAAEGLAESLRTAGYGVYLSPGASGGEARWRVRVGPLGTREAAEAAAERLKTVERLPTWVLDENEG